MVRKEEKKTKKENKKKTNKEETKKEAKKQSSSEEEEPELPPPKRPLASYMRFAKDKREEIVSQHPDLSGREITRKLGEVWRGLSEEEKQPYIDEYEADKERFERQKQEYEQEGRYYDEDGKVVVPEKPKKRKASAPRKSLPKRKVNGSKKTGKSN